jgi:putative addiction module component (TIGR02574 family)
MRQLGALVACAARLVAIWASAYNVGVTTAVERVFKDALSLSDEEREELVAALTQTLAPVDLDPTWKAELARRIAKIESGEAVLHDAELHAQQLRAKYE